MKTLIARFAALLAALLANGTAGAQAPIILVVPFAAGGGTDLTARLMQPELSALLGNQVVTKNTAGAEVARATPDGQILLFTPVWPIATQPNLQRGIRYAAANFAPICQVTDAEIVRLTTRTSGMRTVEDVLARARAANGTMPFASSGIGTIPHISMVAFQRAADIRMVHVPYRGAAR
jgi:tripartite-type tricarboxylate transporter receptor subunit TctC